MGTPCQIDVKLAKVEGRKNATVKDRDGSSYKAPVFMVSSRRRVCVVDTRMIHYSRSCLFLSSRMERTFAAKL